MARRRAGERFVKDAPYDVRDKDAEIRAATSYVPRKSSRNGAVIFNIATFIATCAAVLGIAFAATGGVGIEAIVAMLLAALLVLSSTHIALSWEKVVVLRFGKLNRVVGPGLYFTIPVIEHGTIRVDQRTIATPFYAEKTLTADLVPVTVDAVLFWVVWDAEKACTEVEDYYAAVSFLAQTALREAVGRSTVAEVALRRDQLDIEIKEAQADREKNARMTVAGVEAELAEMLAEAARVYGDPEAALKLRTMLMQYDTVKKSKGTVVTVPTAMSDGFTDSAMMNGDRTTER